MAANSISDLVIISLVTFFATMAMIIFYYRKDKFEPEPILHLVIAFSLGLLSSVISVTSHLIFRSTFSFITGNKIDEFTLIVIVIPIFEEVSKLTMLYLLTRKVEIDGPLDGFIYGALVGAGFTFVENLFFAISRLWESGLSSAVQLSFIRGGYSIIGHPLYTGLIGLGIGAYRVNAVYEWGSYVAKAISMHIAWNFVFYLPGLYTYNFFAFTICFMGVIGYSLNIIKNEIGFAVKIDEKLFKAGYYRKKREYSVYRG
ncbi:MAG: PrsW family intramembrane metalloprotease [Candidatus Kariarchaeaceae archaeon]|jgi:RsiW-degrading membrane proteinase PrsW (M82 family)